MHALLENPFFIILGVALLAILVTRWYYTRVAKYSTGWVKRNHDLPASAEDIRHVKQLAEKRGNTGLVNKLDRQAYLDQGLSIGMIFLMLNQIGGEEDGPGYEEEGDDNNDDSFDDIDLNVG